MSNNSSVTIIERLGARREWLACLPLGLFFMTPVFQLFYCFCVSNTTIFAGDLFYPTLVQIVTVLATAIGLLVYWLFYRFRTANGPRLFFKAVPARAFFVALCLWMIVVTCVTGFTDAAMIGDSYRNESLFAFVTYFALYFLCGTLVSSERFKHTLLTIFLATNTIVNLVVLVDLWITPLKIFSQNESFCAIFFQFNHYGYFLLLGIVLSAALFVTEKQLSRRLLLLPSFLVNTFLLTVNNTFGCFLACFVTLVVLCVVIAIRKKSFEWRSAMLLVLFLFISFLAGLRYPSFIDDSVGFIKDIRNVFGVATAQTDEEQAEAEAIANRAGTGRWILWTHTAEYIAEKPVFGWGIEGIHERLDSETHGVNNRPHNEYLQYAAFFGIPGALLYLSGLLSIAFRGLKRLRSLDSATFVCLVGSFAYLFSALFGNTMFYTAPFLFILLGLSCSPSLSKEAEPSAP